LLRGGCTVILDATLARFVSVHCRKIKWNSAERIAIIVGITSSVSGKVYFARSIGLFSKSCANYSFPLGSRFWQIPTLSAVRGDARLHREFRLDRNGGQAVYSNEFKGQVSAAQFKDDAVLKNKKAGQSGAAAGRGGP
jgi:hypothetical protein